MWRIEARLARPARDVLHLRYRLAGALDALVLPPPAEAGRADRLWRTTCFEAFLRAAGEEGYLELNFAPSRQWAAYRFPGYRGDMRAAAISAPAIMAGTGDDMLELAAELRPGLAAGETWRVGLAAVVEAKDGGLSHWALRHPPGGPDFHHRDCFAVELTPPAQA